eukprot:CAMPEP_0179367840 /NCGR_PEP_ID=MMETSP0797-20121207/83785_1 /TAXON_ID=47934 /ORGANISM="Dinophysis acuminata, Strain DAEP01" /LENGTH=54 /DNA_ID=CAMNT_0021083409 /DNA_START=1 /DNA_END=161 /DNA_ORIENTATION=+
MSCCRSPCSSVALVGRSELALEGRSDLALAGLKSRLVRHVSEGMYIAMAHQQHR